jgi:hypothetical protein
MRLEFDESKSRTVKQKHGVSLREAQEIFDQAYLVDQKNDDPEQFRAIGWCGGRLCSVPKRKSRAMPKTSKPPISADEIAERASRGEDISAYFTNNFTVVRPIHRVNVDLTQGMLRDLDHRAARLNVSRQAVIKTLLERALKEDRSARLRAKRKAG